MIMVATSARVAVPPGTIAVSVRPVISPSATAHFTLASAQSPISSLSVNLARVSVALARNDKSSDFAVLSLRSYAALLRHDIKENFIH